jgi:hypothetical protein
MDCSPVSDSVVTPLDKMPEVKAEKLIREHERMLTSLELIRTVARRESSYADFKAIVAVVDKAIGKA